MMDYVLAFTDRSWCGLKYRPPNFLLQLLQWLASLNYANLRRKFVITQAFRVSQERTFDNMLLHENNTGEDWEMRYNRFHTHNVWDQLREGFPVKGIVFTTWPGFSN